MKFLIALLLACIFGTQIANTINAAARDVTQSQKAACRAGKVML
jgi:hypothetical protein